MEALWCKDLKIFVTPQRHTILFIYGRYYLFEVCVPDTLKEANTQPVKSVE